MKRLFLMLAVCLSLAGSALAASNKAYQVTGKVVSADSDMISVQKGKENFEIARGDDKTDVKVGDKVTVYYKLTATKVEAKSADKAK